MDLNIFNIIKTKISSSVKNKSKSKFIQPHKIVEKFALQLLLTGHCNTACYGCAVFSPLAKETYMNLELIEKALLRMHELASEEVESVNLTGGEPMLHPKLNLFFGLVRRIFPATRIHLCTNGILILKSGDEFWKEMRVNKIILTPTKYPNMPWHDIEKKAKKEDVMLEYYGMEYDNKGKMLPKTSQKRTLDPTGNQPAGNGNNCWRILAKSYNFTLREDGKLFRCSQIATIHYFNEYFNQNFEVCEGDFVNIYKVDNFDSIMDYVSNPLPFCRYCDLKSIKWDLPYHKSKREISEWI